MIYNDFGLSSIRSRASRRYAAGGGQSRRSGGRRVVNGNEVARSERRRRKRYEMSGSGGSAEEGAEGGDDVRRLTGLRRPRLFVWSATPLRPAHLREHLLFPRRPRPALLPPPPTSSATAFFSHRQPPDGTFLRYLGGRRRRRRHCGERGPPSVGKRARRDYLEVTSRCGRAHRQETRPWCAELVAVR